MSIILVLGVLSAALAVSYVMLSTNTTTTLVSNNVDRQEQARMAARAGMSRALRDINSPGWGGVDVALTGTVDTNVSYTVTFTTGDMALLESDPEYAEFPFRLTITSVGEAAEGSGSNVVSRYTATTVVQLERKAMVAAPSEWDSVQGYAICQIGNIAATVEIPARIEGPVRIEGPLSFANSYPGDPTVRQRYFSDLEAYRQDTGIDIRPFTGPLELGAGRTSQDVQDELSQDTNVTVTEFSPSSLYIPWVSIPGYQLYPGGKIYETPNLTNEYGRVISNITLEPDPIENPLGIFRTNGPIQFEDNTTFRGLLVTSGSSPDIRISGSNVKISGVDLPAIEGATQPVQLPTLMSNDDFQIFPATQNCTIKGACLARDDFQTYGGLTVDCEITGAIFMTDLKLFGESTFNVGDTIWDLRHTTFKTLLDLGSLLGIEVYFPHWLNTTGMDPVSKVKIKHSGNAVEYHWHNWYQPVYQPGSSDGGALRWNLVRMSESQK